MESIGIIGFGTVGRSIAHVFAQDAEFRIYDKNKEISQDSFEDTVKESNFIFIGVPTPMKESGEFDSSIIDETIDRISKTLKETSRKIIIIKSTCIPGTTIRLQKEYPNLNIVFSPEFLTERSYRLDAINPSRIIFGINPKDSWIMKKLTNLYRPRFPGYTLHFCDTLTAEMVKYVANSFFAVKLSYFNEIYDICNSLNLNYNRVMKLVLADGRIGNSHHTIPGHDGQRGFGGKCLPKDLNAFINLTKEKGLSPTVMEATWRKNLSIREKKDWEDIKGAVSKK